MTRFESRKHTISEMRKAKTREEYSKAIIEHFRNYGKKDNEEYLEKVVDKFSTISII